MSTILFYLPEDEYGCFSNFSKHPVKINDRIWKTSEHYYQAMKFLDKDIQDMVFYSKGPGSAAKIGRDPNNPLREDWDEVKDDVMREVLYAKFTQNEDCKKTLLDTGHSYLIEDSPVDYYWGIGAKKHGKNMLGRMLGDLRAELRNTQV
jgi:ribA/ribD-fused uncharacterized protein